MNRFLLGILCISLLSAPMVHGQDIKLTPEEAALGYYRDLYPQTLYDLQWLADADWYFHNTGQELIFVDASTLEEKARFSKDIFGISRPWMVSPMYADSKELVFAQEGELSIYDFASKRKLHQIHLPQEAKHMDYEPLQKKVAYTIANNLYVSDKQSNTQITRNEKGVVSGQSIHREEFGFRKGTFWSPKGNYLAFYQKDESRVADYPLIKMSTTGVEVHNIKYPMAGEASERASVGVYEPSTGKLIYLDIDTSDEHYLTNLSWSPDEKYLLIAEVNREQNHYELNRYEASTGKKVNTILEESNDKWVEPEHSAVFLPHKTDEFLWMSEKKGFMKLYWYNLQGRLIAESKDVPWEMTDILGFDKEGKSVFVSGTGADPREQHVFEVILHKKKILELRRVTAESGTHRAQLSPTGVYLLDNFSSISVPRNIAVLGVKTKKSRIILKAENPLRNYAIAQPELVTIKADDGTLLYGVMHKPKDFDANRKYPVLVYVYGGPHDQLVTNSWLAGSALWLPALASTEQYIVFTLDNRGSAHRGFAFESVIHRRLGEMEMKDQMAGVKYLKSLPYVDADRLAVTGWSFGGFMTSSLMLRYQGVFNVAVAGGAVTDWGLYEVMYGERYMDTPEENPVGYANAKVSNYLPNLRGKLLFIHGGNDDVVVPQHVLSLLESAVKNSVQIDYFEYPTHKHNVSGLDRAHLIRKIWDYIVTNNKK